MLEKHPENSIANMSNLLTEQSLSISILVFVLSGCIIAVFGIRMTYIARDLAARTGMGQALMGAVFIGATTSLSGIVASGTAALEGAAELAVSNSLGGIAAQTLFLVLGDFAYKKTNLEFAAASVENLMMSAHLMLLLCILLIAFILPDAGGLSVHPLSVLLFIAYLFTVKLLVTTHKKPMWLPRLSPGTIQEIRSKEGISAASLYSLIAGFVVCAAAVAISGWAISMSGMEIVNRTSASPGIMGGIFIAISTSLPELVIAITAVRAGALTLAVGDIVGGNAFDTLFIAVSDMLYVKGSIYMSISTEEFLWLGTAMLMNCILLIGLMFRERKGLANIGMESSLILMVYLCAVIYMLM